MKRRSAALACGAVVAAALLLATPPGARPTAALAQMTLPDSAMLLNAASNPKEWLM